MKLTTKKSGAKQSLSRALPLLGGISAQVFLRDYWQKKPLLIRNAIPGFVAPLSKNEVLTLARRDDAESRLIKRNADAWQIDHGPFSSRDFRQPKNILWTVLVQDVQHFSFEAHELLAHFNFIPQARIDDLMVSYAVAGAGVGAHFDSYDVFLLQGAGKRRWQISTQKNLRLIPELPLKILADFKPTDEFVLDTGDMLYLPPSVAHHGIAETECLTWSVGFRAPSTQDLSVAFLDHLRDAIQLPGQYTDSGIPPTFQPARIDSAMQRRIALQLEAVRAATCNNANVNRFAGCYLTEPKPHIVFDLPQAPIAARDFWKLAGRYGLELDLKTRILYDDSTVFINGKAHALRHGGGKGFREMANRRILPASSMSALQSGAMQALVYECYCEGAILIARH